MCYCQLCVWQTLKEQLTLTLPLLSLRRAPASLALSCSTCVPTLFATFVSFGITPLLRSSICRMFSYLFTWCDNVTGWSFGEKQSVYIDLKPHLSRFMGQYGRYCIFPQKLFAIVVSEAFGAEMLWTEAGVRSRDKVSHAQALYPFGSKLRLAEREPDIQ